MTRAKAKAQAAQPNVQIPQEQYNLPAGYSRDGSQMVTLGDIVSAEMPALVSLAEMTPEQRAELVARRIEMQPKFQIAMIGAGLIDKERAIAEVKAQSDVGRALIEVEQRLLNHLMEQITQAH